MTDATFFTLQRRFKTRRLTAFAIPALIVLYLAYLCISFDIAGLAARATEVDALLITPGPDLRYLTGYEALARIQEADGSISTPADWGMALEDPECARRIDRQILRCVIADWPRLWHDLPALRTPRPVPSRRPSEPPSAMGLPVTTPETVAPSFME